MKSVMRKALLWTCLAGLPLALAACQGEKKARQGGSAEGEILPGSASDAMLPYDTVRSQPPLAPIPVATGKAARSKGGGADDEAAAEDGEPADEVTPAPSPASATPAAE